MSKINCECTVAIYERELQTNNFCTDSKDVVSVTVDSTLYFLDGAKPGATIASFVNHSCDPNTCLATYIFKSQLYIVLVSLKTIQPQEFISFDYGNKYKIIKICFCGSGNCCSKVIYEK